MLNVRSKRVDPDTFEENSQKRQLLALEALDFTNVKRKIMEPDPEGKGWNQAQADQAEKWYRRFLSILILHPEAQHVPNYPIDMFWHQHILDTRAYANDCQKVFGRFIHHYPYFGLNGDADLRDDAFDETNRLYRKEFGEDCKSMNLFFRPRAEACTPDFTEEEAKEVRDQTKGERCTPKDMEEKTLHATSCSPPCTSEACGSGCKQCTVDGVKREVVRQAVLGSHDQPQACMVTCGEAKPLKASSCGHGGSGTGCGGGNCGGGGH